MPSAMHRVIGLTHTRSKSAQSEKLTWREEVAEASQTVEEGLSSGLARIPGRADYFIGRGYV